jgi:uncharacterized protein/uncharacterized protein YjbI with pentapeptide repeats
MTRTPGLVLGLALVLAIGAARAEEQRGCSVPPPDGRQVRVRTPQDLARLDPAKPVLAWIGADSDRTTEPLKGFSPAVLRRLQLQPGSVLSGLDLDGANLAGWRVPGLVLSQVSLAGATLTDAVLAKGCMDGGSLEGADLSGADLGGFVTDQTELAGARFARAKLGGAALQCAPFMMGSGCAPEEKAKPMDFSGADLAKADISGPTEAFGAVLAEARLDETALPITADLFKQTAGARITSARLKPAAHRSGAGQLFTAADLEGLRKLAGADPLAVLRDLSQTASFDCGGKLTPIEQAICGNPMLAGFDRVMADAYRQRLAKDADKASVQAAQQAFLKTRNSCRPEDAECLLEAHLIRLKTISRELPPGLPAGKPVLFVDAPYQVRPPFAKDPLAAKLLAAWGDSTDAATLTRDGDGIVIGAYTLGGNGHTCSFEATLKQGADGLWRDPDDEDSMSWMLLPGAVVNASDIDKSRFYCGASAGWPNAFLRKN